MGLLNKFFGNKNVNKKDVNNSSYKITNLENKDNIATENKPSNKINLSKEESLNKVNLRKETVNKVCLAKKELTNLTSRVAVVMDYSVSMEDLYYNGTVQSVLERLLPLALKFDDNGELETWIFEKGFNRLKDINIDNYYGYIKNENILMKYNMGGTNYAPVMKDVVQKYIKENPLNIPTLVLFLTDGDNFDKKEATNIIKESSKYPIFWQFVGLGNSSYSFLESLDEMDGRFVDNANFFSVDDINKISDESLYNKLLNEYPEWLKEIKEKNILK